MKFYIYSPIMYIILVSLFMTFLVGANPVSAYSPAFYSTTENCGFSYCLNEEDRIWVNSIHLRLEKLISKHGEKSRNIVLEKLRELQKTLKSQRTITIVFMISELLQGVKLVDTSRNLPDLLISEIIRDPQRPEATLGIQEIYAHASYINSGAGNAFFPYGNYNILECKDEYGSIVLALRMISAYSLNGGENDGAYHLDGLHNIQKTGTQKLFCMIDPENKVHENNENNNSYPFSFHAQ